MGTTSKTKMTNVIKMLTILSIRVALYNETSVFLVFAASSGVRKYLYRVVRSPFSHARPSFTYHERGLLQIEPLLEGAVNLSDQCLDTTIKSCSFAAITNRHDIFLAAN